MNQHPKSHPIREISAMAGAFVGILVGAGFSSGQEIVQFFAGYGRIGLVGCLVTGIGFLILPVLFSVIGYRMKATSHKEVVRTIMGKWLWHLFDVLVTFFQFAYTVVMIAGGGALLQQWLGLPVVIGSIVMALCTIGIVCLDLRKIIIFISAVTPLLCVMVVLVAGWVLMGPHADYATLEAAAVPTTKASSHWLLSAALYVSFCIVIAMPFLVIMGGQSSSSKVAAWGGVAGGALIGILIALSATALYFRMDKIAGLPMPMMEMVMQIAPWLGHVLSLVIFGMILNSAVGTHYVFVARVMPANSPASRFKLAVVGIGLVALACSFVGFVKLVNTVYPMYGYIGFVLIAFAIVAYLRWNKVFHNIGAGGM